MRNPRKGEPGHRPELRERTGRTPTKRERVLLKAIDVQKTRTLIAARAPHGRGSFFDWLEALSVKRFGEHRTGRGRWANPRKAGPGRRGQAPRVHRTQST